MMANVFSGGAIALFLANIESIITIAVLATALAINIHRLYKIFVDKRGESGK